MSKEHPVSCSAMLISALFLAVTVAVVGCGGGGKADSQPPPPSVTVTPAEMRNLYQTFQYVGRTEGVESVDLRARVEGSLGKRSFDEGSDVARGDLLFEIDRASYVAAVSEAEGRVADTMAVLSNTRQYLQRLRAVDDDAISAADLDAAASTEQEAQAKVQQAQAALERAQISLSHTRIRAPIDGRIGRAVVTTGNLVGPGSGVLATLVRLDPINVTFNVNERDLLTARQELLERGGTIQRYVPRLTLANGTDYPRDGEIDFVDNHVDPSTGTVIVRAVFPNPDRLLLPGQFVTVRIARDEPTRQLVIPQMAVQQDQSGHYVLVVDKDNVAQRLQVKLGSQEGAWWTVESGLLEGDNVIYEGVQRVAPGIVVNPSVRRPDVGERN